MNTPKVFEQIMKGAILKGAESPDEMAHRMGAVELKAKIKKAEYKKAKADMQAAEAEAKLAAMHKGAEPGISGQGTSAVPMVDHPRPGAGVEHQGSTSGLDGEHEEHVPMVTHPRPGEGGASMDKALPPQFMHGKKDGDGKDGKPNPFAKKPGAGSDHDDDDEDDKKKPPFMKKSIDEMSADELRGCIAYSNARSLEKAERIAALSKALSTAEHGEPGVGAGAFNGATRTSADLGSHDIGHADGSPFGSLGSMNGLPSPDTGRDEQFSEDDRNIGSPMPHGAHPLEAGAVDGGPSGLEASAHHTMGGDVSAAGGAKAGNGGMSKSSASASSRAHQGVTDDASRDALAGQYAQARAGMQKGMVYYDQSEDARVSGLMEKAQKIGYGVESIGEPTLNFQAPLLKSCICGHCQKSMPSMLTTCPNCGNDRTGAGHGTTTAYLSKSVKDAIRGPVTEGSVHPGGTLVIPD